LALLKRKGLRWISLPAVAILAIAAATPLWLPWIGLFLENAGPPEKADTILVLAGDNSGNRIRKGGELARQGYAPSVLVSGPDGFYGYLESELAIDFAVKQGFPRELFISCPMLSKERSTRGEAAVMIRELRNRGVHRFLLVTSDFHTRRAGSIYRTMAPDLEMRVVAASFPQLVDES
jgi:uncharacterized SAM-binding protein YcdF (DUF218 family)